MPDYVTYSTKREPTDEVDLNLDPEFLIGCDCTDDCQVSSCVIDMLQPINTEVVDISVFNLVIRYYCITSSLSWTKTLRMPCHTVFMQIYATLFCVSLHPLKLGC